MRGILKAAALVLLAAVLTAPAFAAPANEAPPFFPDAHATKWISKTPTDDIFLAGLETLPAPEFKAYWGRCSQSCAICWSASGCPRDDDGTPQSCMPYCP